MSEDKSKPLFGENAFVPVLLGLPIMLLAAGGIWAFRSRGSVMATLEQGEAAGRAYAASSSTTAKRSPSECLDGAIGSLDDLAEPREPGAAAFLAACLQVSGHARLGDTKQSAPRRGLLEGWARDECAARGHGDQTCSRFIQVADVDPCRDPFKGQTKAPPRWDCQ